MNVIRPILIAAVFSNLVGCATYFKRKACEETNWHQHGLNVAMAGNRLDADPFIHECQKVEANFSFAEADAGFKEGMAKYCESGNVFAVGKSGREFSFDLCDGRSIKQMRAEHARGVNEFCKASNGYPYGSSGQVYGKICPGSLEPEFLKEYRRGRIVYLRSQISETTNQISEVEMKIRRIQSDKMARESELQALTRHRQTTINSVRLNPVTGVYESQTTTTENSEIESRIRDVKWKIDNLDSEMQSAQREIESLQERARRYRSEKYSLENE